MNLCSLTAENMKLCDLTAEKGGEEEDAAAVTDRDAVRDA